MGEVSPSLTQCLTIWIVQIFSETLKCFGIYYIVPDSTLTNYIISQV